MKTTQPGSERGISSLDHLYAKTLDKDDDRFNLRSGVFYPSGYALLAMPDTEKLAHAVAILVDGGVAQDQITLLRPDQMRELTDGSQANAGLLARVVGAELKQLEVLEQLADVGNHFILVHNTDKSRKLLETIGSKSGVSKGLLYHSLAVEELPVDKETIPGTSPFGVNEVIRSQDSDADMGGKHEV